MSETLGQFRLMHKIENDVLGDVYCAAWRDDDDGREQIVSLRLFDREGLDPERFLERVNPRRSLIGMRLSDQLGTSRGLGVVEGRAYDVFPVVSGKSLASLIRRATRQRQTFPLEVALFIAGRLASGLAAAYRQEIDGENLMHGFVVPHLVVISEEGGVQLCGLEAAPALRELRGTASTFARILPYLPPEAREGKDDLHPSDDVYSLGALLYELLTLEPLASPADLRIETAKIATELRYFLARSVAPRSLRIQSAVEWMRELKALVVQEGWIASAPDLSAFLAAVDERVNPLKPDTSEITTSDRQALAEAIRKARAEAGEPAASIDGPPTRRSKGESYETSVIARDILRPLVDEGKLVRTSHVKRASDSLPLPPA